jgi:hypothetical protein
MSDICAETHTVFNKLKRFKFPYDASAIPLNGIYVMFESGERAHGGDRIVRVGSHTGANQLRSRLQQHFLNENKDRSIFRKHIGRTILNKARDPFLEQWNWDLTPHKAKEKYEKLLDKPKQKEIERKVTAYLQNSISFVVFPEEDKDQRIILEKKIIATIASCRECQPSNNWLGSDSPKHKICECGLWQEKDIFGEPLSVVDIRRLQLFAYSGSGLTQPDRTSE